MFSSISLMKIVPMYPSVCLYMKQFLILGFKWKTEQTAKIMKCCYWKVWSPYGSLATLTCYLKTHLIEAKVKFCQNNFQAKVICQTHLKSIWQAAHPLVFEVAYSSESRIKPCQKEYTWPHFHKTTLNGILCSRMTTFSISGFESLHIVLNTCNK